MATNDRHPLSTPLLATALGLPPEIRVLDVTVKSVAGQRRAWVKGMTEGCRLALGPNGACPGCGPKGTTPSQWHLSPIQGAPTEMTLHTVRRECRRGEPQQTALDGLIKRHKMSTALYVMIVLDVLRGNSFTSVAEWCGVSRTKPPQIMREFARIFDASYPPTAGRYLALDTAYLGSSLPYTSIHSIHPKGSDQRSHVVDLVRGGSAAPIARALRRLRDCDLIEIVTIDASPALLRAVEDGLGAAVRVALDKWHILSALHQPMNAVRHHYDKTIGPAMRNGRTIKAKPLLEKRLWMLTADELADLDTLLNNRPDLAEIHKVKEAYRDALNLRDPARCDAELDLIAQQIRRGSGAWVRLQRFINMMEERRHMVLLTVEHQLSTAAVEQGHRDSKYLYLAAGGNLTFEGLRLRRRARGGPFTREQLEAAAISAAEGGHA